MAARSLYNDNTDPHHSNGIAQSLLGGPNGLWATILATILTHYISLIVRNEYALIPFMVKLKMLSSLSPASLQTGSWQTLYEPVEYKMTNEVDKDNLRHTCFVTASCPVAMLRRWQNLSTDWHEKRPAKCWKPVRRYSSRSRAGVSKKNILTRCLTRKLGVKAIPVLLLVTKNYYIPLNSFFCCPSIIEKKIFLKHNELCVGTVTKKNAPCKFTECKAIFTKVVFWQIKMFGSRSKRTKNQSRWIWYICIYISIWSVYEMCAMDLLHLWLPCVNLCLIRLSMQYSEHINVAETTTCFVKDKVE